tara:strand:- start:349 stop:1335 length:987 start_codon:yes stop_codon:yes gene_type:complete
MPTSAIHPALGYLCLIALLLSQSVLSAEVRVQQLKLPEPWAHADLGYSGMTWCGPWLVLLPQYPQGKVIGFTEQQLSEGLDGKPLTAPKVLPFQENKTAELIPDFEGYEGLICQKERAWLLAETNSRKKETRSYLIPADFNNEDLGFKLHPRRAIAVPSTELEPNLGNEAIALVGEHIFSFYEHNSNEHFSETLANLIDPSPLLLNQIPIVDIPFRITDATNADTDNRLWVLNYFYTGDTHMQRRKDPIQEQFGSAPTHRQAGWVERILELKVNTQGIQLSGRPPVNLHLKTGQGRNWEGLARFGNRGFLVVTDRFPETIFGFVPYEY